jgi:hypothetical protein
LTNITNKSNSLTDWQHFHLKFQDMSPGPGKKCYTIYIQKLRN